MIPPGLRKTCADGVFSTEEAGEYQPWVYVVDDEPGVRRYLERLIGDAGLQVEAFPSAQEFLRHEPSGGPACLLLDMRLPGLDGLELQKILADQENLLPIVFITGYGDIRTSVQAMKSGAVDFLTKPLEGAEVLAAIAQAIERSRREWVRLRHIERLESRLSTLTPRELEVIQRVVRGRLNKQIAAELGIVEKTVKVHRARAMHKLGARSVVELSRLLGQLDLAASSFPMP